MNVRRLSQLHRLLDVQARESALQLLATTAGGAEAHVALDDLLVIRLLGFWVVESFGREEIVTISVLELQETYKRSVEWNALRTEWDGTRGVTRRFKMEINAPSLALGW